ncbi:MAG: hypothetical protein R2807_04560 [Chitinophagales bacterium]
MESNSSNTMFIEVVLPLALPKLYTYAVPKTWLQDIQIGKRVEVQFGKQKLYTAIIFSISALAPTDYVPKEILSIVDEQPILTIQQLILAMDCQLLYVYTGRSDASSITGIFQVRIGNIFCEKSSFRDRYFDTSG